MNTKWIKYLSLKLETGYLLQNFVDILYGHLPKWSFFAFEGSREV